MPKYDPVKEYIEDTGRGWFWPINMNTPHFFVNGRSLCGRVLTFSNSFEDNKHTSPDNCKSCMKKREKFEITIAKARGQS